MSMNKFMHPRNIYKVPPDFTELAIHYSEFREISQLNLNGRVTVDFKNPETIRVLTKVLLKKDFNLDVHLPTNRLVPTLPLRLNYLLWIEDVLKFFKLENIVGVDIGCGASCIYPLLAVTLYKWKMYALETNKESYDVAVDNLTRNNFTALITVIKQENEDPIFQNIPEHGATFSMCNPPFYNLDDLSYKTKPLNNRTGNRKPPKNGQTGNSNELFVEGGEINFITKIINESKTIRDKIKIYTTMLGHKHSLQKIISLFRSNGINNFIKTEFCQGNTTRWGIAWSFVEDKYYLRSFIQQNIICSTAPKKYTPLIYEIMNFELNVVEGKLKFIFIDLLKLTIKLLECKIYTKTWEIVANENTWSHQRRKRRQTMRKPTSIIENEINLETDKILNGNDCEVVSKRIKRDDNNSNESSVVLKALVTLTSKEEDGNKIIVLEIGYLDGHSGKDGVHQIMQFIMNKFKENQEKE